ncbi:MAG: hypothetical protein IPL39_05210 [Opitutaceae bacterium]|nr:hypothetical protein [Opitutaceae bacterium]
MRTLRLTSLALVLALGGINPLHAILDTNGDGISDLWEQRYPTAGSPIADPDGDGASNLAESVAGTDPFNSASGFRGTVSNVSDGTIRLRWPSIQHKRYQIEASTDLRNWSGAGTALLGTGAELSTVVRAAGATAEPRRYWRVAVSDLDANSDGISDWEETISFARITAAVEANGRASYANASPATISKWLTAQNTDGSWPDIDYSDTSSAKWAPIDHLNRLAYMASDFTDTTSSLYHSAAVTDAFTRGLQFWLTRRPVSTNVWQNDIGVPLALGPALVLMRNQLSTTLLTSALELIPLQPHDASWATGENLVWYSGGTIHRALLAGNAALLARSVAQIESTLEITAEEGINVDGSFIQHSTQIYNGGYGLGLLGDVARWVPALAGTAFAIDDTHRTCLDHLLLDGDAWMIRGTTFDYSTQGRNYARAESEKPNGLAMQVRAYLNLILASGSPRATELQALRDQIDGNSVGLVGHKHFWRADYSVHREAPAMVSLRLISKRSVGAECGNNENRRGLFQGCGETLIYRDGLEYHQIFPVWNWLRLPGTTLEQTAAVPPFYGYVRGTGAFTGGVTDGAVGLSAYAQADLKASRTLSTPTEVRPMPAARKSWFFFGDGFLALGAGITSSATNPIFTTVNQTLLRGDVRLQTSGTGFTAPAGESDFASTRWVQHDGVGYVFPSPATVHLAATAQTGSWSLITTYASTTPVTKNVFTLGFDHGVAPTNATYAYVVLPGADEPTTAAFATQNPVTILANTPLLQAARLASRDLSAVAFFDPGSITLKPGLTVASDQPALVLVRGVSAGLEITVAEPTQLLTTLNLSISGQYTVPGAVYDPVGNTTRVTVTLPSGQLAGSSVTLRLSAK